MIDRYPLLAFALTCILGGYLCFAIPATDSMAAKDKFTGCEIAIVDSLNTGFVNQAELSQDCGDIMQWITERSREDLDIGLLEQQLRSSDKVEKVNVHILNNGVLAIDVLPMSPVARVFAENSSYYINESGKRISADPRYHVDVPVVVGHFTDEMPPARLLPLLGYIASRPELDALVSTVKQSQNGDIIIVPTLRGHVINFGDTALMADKFNRIYEFYRQVMPIRGWETYDTLSVKWRGQVIGVRRDKTLGRSSLASQIEEFDDIDDSETMTSPLHSPDNNPDA